MRHKNAFVPVAICCSLFIGFSPAAFAADNSNTSTKPKLEVLEMQQVPTGLYDVQLQIEGEKHTVKLAIKGSRAAFVEATSNKLEGLSGEFDLIGNGVFLARLAGSNHRASQLWVFHPDGSATVKEIPDRGEKQIAKPSRK